MAKNVLSRSDARRFILRSRITHHPLYKAIAPRDIGGLGPKMGGDLRVPDLTRLSKELHLDDPVTQEIDLYLKCVNEIGLSGRRAIKVVNLFAQRNGWGGKGLIELPDGYFSTLEEEKKASSKSFDEVGSKKVEPTLFDTPSAFEVQHCVGVKKTVPDTKEESYNRWVLETVQSRMNQIPSDTKPQVRIMERSVVIEW